MYGEILLTDFVKDWQEEEHIHKQIAPLLYPLVWGKYELVIDHYSQTQLHIDTRVWTHAGIPETVETKIVRWPGYHYSAVTLETHSDSTSAPPDEVGDGWMAQVGHGGSYADYLLWVFRQPDETWWRIWLFRLPALREWFLPILKRYPSYDTPNKGYMTLCRKVPLRDIPYRCRVRFDWWIWER